MPSLTLAQYEPESQSSWDGLVALARNGVFLFHRGYLEYHRDRFPDASLLAFDEEKLLAVLPATRGEDVFSSHAGLTFGGFVLAHEVKLPTVLALFDLLAERLRGAGCRRLLYKPVPHIYHRAPAEEDLYALHRMGARLVRREASSAIDREARLSPSKGRRAAIQRGRRERIELAPSEDFTAFMAIEERLLEEKYGARPVHTAAELELLARRFPEQIRLFVARRRGELLAGVVVYESDRVAHTQYIATTDSGRALGALDALLAHLIEERYRDRRFFDLGTSSAEGGLGFNAGLLHNKQSYGARSVVYDCYQLDL
jgi:hypothetical protein